VKTQHSITWFFSRTTHTDLSALLDANLLDHHTCRYISQPQKFRRSKKTQEIHRMAKARPPKDMKAPSLILSWELYSKHLLREVAEEGALRLLVPIGKELSTMLSRERVEEAVTVAGAPACAIESIPAPNAWIPGSVLLLFTSSLRT